jgi:DNA polymerase-3 subunit delta'
MDALSVDGSNVDASVAESMPWLAGERRRLREAREVGRLPHSMLLLSAPGLGAESLAGWTAALALCEGSGERPCGACTSCALLRSASHPDFHVVRLEEDAKQIKIDQIRELIDALSLMSYRGGFKVGIIEGAEALNANGANAFLKTLEEPSGDTLLILVARPSHRLPATIASRCLRMVLRPPSADVATAWLDAHGRPGRQWTAALALSAGAPLLALEFEGGDVASLENEMQQHIRSIAAGTVDVTLLADAWSRSNLPLRMLWLENWITGRVREQLGEGASSHSAQRGRLPAALLKAKIRALFELLDAARELRRLGSTGMNQQLALEALLLGGRAALAT